MSRIPNLSRAMSLIWSTQRAMQEMDEYFSLMSGGEISAFNSLRSRMSYYRSTRKHVEGVTGWKWKEVCKEIKRLLSHRWLYQNVDLILISPIGANY